MTISQTISQPIAQAINSPITGGSAAYTTTASDYDGTNDDARRGADLTGNANSFYGIIAFTFELNGGDGLNQYLYWTPNNHFIIRKSDNTIRCFLRDTAAAVAADFSTVATYTAAATHNTLILAWNTSNATTTLNWAKLYINDTLVGSDLNIPNVEIAVTDTNHAFGARAQFNDLRFNGCFSELFVHYGATLDPGVEENRRKFFDAAGKPVDKGADGSTPLGVQPLVYAPDGDPSTNLGSGGNFTITGALTACSTSPTD